jgi:hypothetical protein
MDKGASYTIVQHASFYVQATAIDVVCSRSNAAMPTDPANASEGEIRVAENYTTEENWIQDLDFDTMLDNASSVNTKPKWYKRDEDDSYAIVQHFCLPITAAATATMRPFQR